MPDCMLFSTGRAGSTSVYKYLDAMCCLNLPRNKEPHFWLEDAANFRNAPRILGKIQVRDRANYDALYANARMSIDASVAYYHNVSQVVSRLVSAGENPRIIMLVREPISWARSLHVENLYQGIETEPDLAQCISQDCTDTTLWWQSRYRDIRYLEVFELLSRTFPDVMVVDHQELVADAETAMRRICNFLGLSPAHPLPKQRHHESKARIAAMKAGALGRWVERFPTSVQHAITRLPGGPRVPSINDISDETLSLYLAESLESYAALSTVHKGELRP